MLIINNRGEYINMTQKDELKKEINNSIKKIEEMIKENKSEKNIYKEKEKLDKLLNEYLKK